MSRIGILLTFVLIFLSCERIWDNVEDEDNLLPIVLTSSIAEIKLDNAKVSCKIVEPNDSKLIEKGICYGLNMNPTINDLVISNNESGVVYSCDITNLNPDTRYFARAYAINKFGIGYGDSKVFRTKNGFVNVEIDSIKIISSRSVNCYCSVYDDGGYEIIEKGVVWNTHEFPTINDSIGKAYALSMQYQVSTRNMNGNVKYFLRPFVKTDNGGIRYGEQWISITPSSLPSIITKRVRYVSENRAQTGGIIFNTGGYDILEKGICYSTEEEPDINDQIVVVDSYSLVFDATIEGLANNTKYYCRAYAVNEEGVSYGKEFEFETFTEGIDFFTDLRDGLPYKKIVIGNQTWMAENLAYLPYLNIIEDIESDNFNDLNYFIYGNRSNSMIYIDSIHNYCKYGVLYNWKAAIAACPDGWHLPTKEEYEELVTYVSNNGYANQVAVALKCPGEWEGEGEGVDAFGFTARPGGAILTYSDSYYAYAGLNRDGYWWTSSAYDESNSYFFRIVYDNYYIQQYDQKNARSIRCIKNEENN